MGEVVNVLVAFAVIVFLVKWVTTSKEQPNSPASVLGFHPKNVNDQMVDAVHNMFPNIPRPNIHYSLLRTGSVQVTSNTILEKGFLDHPPPAYFALYTQQSQPQPQAEPQASQHTNRQGSSTSVNKPEETLISRFKLESRLSSKSSELADVAGKAVWESTPEAREKSLQERKVQMILAARTRLLEQQKNTKLPGSSQSSS